MKDRIREIQEWANLSQQDFANRLGISPASLSSIFTGRTNPTNNHVQAIHRAFPEINVSWLLFGEGSMMDSSALDVPLNSEKNFSSVQANGVSIEDDTSMAPIFKEEDFVIGSAESAIAHNSSIARGRDYQSGRPVGFHFNENAKKIDIKERKIKEIRVFFDDGTYEAFVPSGGK